jgi:transposase
MVSEADKRRYRLYNRRNKGGGRVYRIGDIAKMEGVSRQAIHLSLRKFKTEAKEVLDNNVKG